VTSLALFDLDNTLLDREKAFDLWIKQFIGVHGLNEDVSATIKWADADGYNPREGFFAELRRGSYNQNLWMHHLTGGATYLPL
jgi:FMN phosphatase YigB (HAD superfamily)